MIDVFLLVFLLKGILLEGLKNGLTLIYFMVVDFFVHLVVWVLVRLRMIEIWIDLSGLNGFIDFLIFEIKVTFL